MSEVKEKLDEYINQGNYLLDGIEVIKGMDDVDDQKFEFWKNTVIYFIRQNFNNKIVLDFENAKNIHNKYLCNQSELKKKLGVLNAIKENFSYFEKNNSPKKQSITINSNKIFIVHGRDDTAKISVESFLKNLGLEPIILHKQANQGQTIIEKIEAHSDVAFAVVLLTPDDEGRLKGEEKLEDRARQNVIFELGYFIARLERKNVCGLCTEGFKLPSDYDGVLYIPMDKHDGWHKKLAKEIKASGIEFDMNKLLEV